MGTFSLLQSENIVFQVLQYLHLYNYVWGSLPAFLKVNLKQK